MSRIVQKQILEFLSFIADRKIMGISFGVPENLSSQHSDERCIGCDCINACDCCNVVKNHEIEADLPLFLVQLL